MKSRLRKSRFTLTLAALFTGALAAQAADVTWTGLNSANWNDSGNWNPGIPSAGDTLIFDTSGQTSPFNDIIDGVFGGIKFTPTAAQYVLGGNSIALDGALVVNSNTALQTLSLPLVLTNTVTFNTVSNLDTTVGDIAVTGAVTGSGALVKTGGGTLILSAKNHSGGTTINEGLLIVSNDNGGFTLSGGSLLMNFRTYFMAPTLTMTADAGIGISLPDNAEPRGLDMYGAINAGGFKFTKIGEGLLRMAGGGINNPSQIDVAEGILANLGPGTIPAGAARWGGTNVPITVAYGATLRADDCTYVPNPVTLNGGPGAPTQNGTLGSLVGGTRNGSAANATNLFTGAITLTTDSTAGVAAGVLVIAGNITGAGGLTKVGSGPLVLGGTNNYGGNTVVSAGTLRLESSFAIPGGVTNGNLNLDGDSTLDLNGFNASVNGLYTDGSGTPVINNSAANSATLTLGGNDATINWTGPLNSSGGPLSIVKIGTGTASFLGVNAHTGSNVVSGGTLELNIPVGTTTGGLVALANGTTLTLHKTTASSSLKASGATFGTSSSTTLNIDLGNWGNASLPVINATNGTGILAVNGAVTVTFSGLGNIALGQFPLIKYTTRTGTGGFVLTPLGGGLVASIVTNTLNKSIDLLVTTAPITTWKGNVNNLWDTTTANWTFSGSPTVYADGNAVFFPDGALTNVVDLTAAVYPSSTLYNSTNNYVFTGAGSLAGGDLTKNGSGRLTLVTDNSYNNTFISAGTLQIGSNGTTGSLGLGTVSVDGTLEIVRSDDINVANTISGSGVVVQANTNALTLSAANTYSGGTLVNQGIVKLGSATALGVPAVGLPLATVASGAALDVNNQMTTATNFLVISGNGVAANQGALFNSLGQGCEVGCAKFGVRTLSLAGDSAIGNDGGSFSIGNSLGSPAGSLINGNGFKLTKIGNNTLILSSVAGTAPSHFIIAGGGVLQTSPNPIGGTIVISNNAWMDVFDNVNNSGFTLTNALVIGAGGGQLRNTRGPFFGQAARNTYTGAVTLNDVLTIQNTIFYSGAPNNVLTLGTVTFTGPITGPGGINSIGATNPVTLTGPSTYTGPTTVTNNGLLLLSTVQQGGGAYTNYDNATLDVPTQNGYATVPMSALSVGSLDGAILNFSRVTSLSPVNAIVTATNLTVVGTNAIVLPALAYATPGQYPLIKYFGTLNGGGTFVAGGAGVRGTPATISNNVANGTIDLVVPGGNPVTWVGNVDNTWDIAGVSNFKYLGSSTTYEQSGSVGDAVTFDDSSAVTNVNLTVPVSPAVVVVNTTNTYSLAGTNITGTAALVKSGSGVLLLTNRNNNFTGGTLVSGGTLKLANGLNNLVGTVTVFTNATFDMGSNNPTTLVLNLNGSGVGGAGAFQANYSGGAQAYGPSIVNLLGNTTIGGNNRWDLRNGSKQLNAVTPNTSLTKVGSGYFGLVAAAVSTNVGDITILGGRISYQTSTAGLGHTNGTITIGGSGALGFFASTVPLVKNIICSNGASIYAESGNTLGQNVIAGPVNLVSGTTTIKGNFFNGLYISNTISGAGSLAMEFQSYLYLAASNTFTGTLTVPNCNASNGGRGTRLSFIGNGSATKASQIYIQGIAPGQAFAGWIALEGRPDATLTLGANQLLRGDNGSYIRGSVLAPATSAIAPGGINNSNYQYMIVATNLTLQAGSTNYMDIYKAGALRTNDLIMVTNLLTFGGTLQIRTNGPTALTVGDTFKLYQAGSVSGNFATVADNSGTSWSFNPATGVATVTALAPTVNTNAVNINAVVGVGDLQLSWPPDHLGWRLEVQTNAISVGLSTNWFTWPGSATVTNVTVPLNPANPAVFLRLVYP